MEQRASKVFGSGLAAIFVFGCAEPEPLPELPEPPVGSELVLEVGRLEVYRAFEGKVCTGTLRRIEAHTWALSDLFGIEPPHARLVLYATTEGIVDACPYDSGVLGCASANYGRAVPTSALHELVHIFAQTSTGVRTRPFLEEGLAFRLDGTPALPPGTLRQDLRELLAVPSPFAPGLAPSEFFAAWSIDRFGFDALLDAHVAVAHAASDADAEDALAYQFGLSSIDELQSEWEADPHVYYPPLPDTIPTFSVEQLSTGVSLNSACDASFTEGPFDGWVETRARIEIPEAGQYEVVYPDTTYATSELPDFPVSRDLTVRHYPDEPISCEDDGCLEDGIACPYDVPVPRLVFPSPGPYEFRALHPLSEPASGMLSIHRIDGEECTY